MCLDSSSGPGRCARPEEIIYVDNRGMATCTGTHLGTQADPVCTLAEALASGEALTAWPEGSLIVKDGYNKGEQHLVAAMEKREGGWFWAEYKASGEVSYSGDPGVCTRCHDAGADYVRAFGFP